MKDAPLEEAGSSGIDSAARGTQLLQFGTESINGLARTVASNDYELLKDGEYNS